MDDSVEIQPGGSNDTDNSLDAITDSQGDITSVDPSKAASDRVFDISEDNIAEVKEANVGSMQVFPIKKMVAKPQTPKTLSSTMPPTPSLPTTPFVTPESSSNISPENQPLSSTKPETSTPSSDISRFATEKLPEIPAFKGTLDQKPSTFEPKSFIKSHSESIQKNPKENSSSVAQNLATPVSEVPDKKIPVTPPPSPQPDSPKPLEVPVTTQSTQTPPAPIKDPTLATNSSNIEPTPVVSKNLLEQTPIPDSPTTKEKSIGSIPLKDITRPRNIPANPPAKVLGAIPNPSNENKFEIPDDPGIKRLRTYESDIAEIMSQKNISAASIAIAENKRNQKPIDISSLQQNAEEDTKQTTPSTSNKNISKFILILISIIFIFTGIVGGYYLYSKSVFGLKPTILGINLGVSNPSIFTPDSKTTLNIGGMNPNTIVAAIKQEWEKPQNPDTIQQLVITDGQKQVTGPQMIEFMDIDAPDILKRSLTDDWMLGISTDTTGNKDLFVIATTNFFQNAFAGMFQWESVMADDLKLFLSSGMYQGIVNAPISTSTITVKGPTIELTVSDTEENGGPSGPYYTLRGQFEDRTIMNEDVRVFRTAQGKILFFYSFVDKSTLVVASKEYTLIKILDRLENKAFIR